MSFHKEQLSYLTEGDLTFTNFNDTVLILGHYKPDELNAEELGGKGLSLITMSSLGLRVPKALIIPIQYGSTFAKVSPSFAIYKALRNEIDVALSSEVVAQFLATGHTLFSVRSGAMISMAGMMDTILNVGSLSGHTSFRSNYHDNQDFVDDCQNRFLAMFGKSSCGNEAFSLQQLNDLYLSNTWATSDHVTRAKVWEHLKLCVGLVYDSWNSDRAKYYRERNNIDNGLGTAVIIQQMVFGNLNEQSCTGVVFSRNPNTGENILTGEYLTMAQGEDVVSGSVTPKSLSELADSNEELYTELLKGVTSLESHRRDVQDVEFTVQNGSLYFLQTRDAKRTVAAAMKIIQDMEAEVPSDTPIDFIKRLKNLDVNALASCHTPTLNPTKEPDHVGLGSCPGGISGIPCFDLSEILINRSKGKTIYVAVETSPDDIKCLDKADAILTLRGGSTSHAAVVARAMNKPCVVGVTSLHLETVKNPQVQKIAICGSTGGVWLSEQPEGESGEEQVERFLEWFFGKLRMPLVRKEVSYSDVLCNRLQKSEELQLYINDRYKNETFNIDDIPYHLALGKNNNTEHVNRSASDYGLLVVGRDGYSEGNKIKKVGSLVELLRHDGPAILTKAAEKSVDADVLGATMELRSRLYGVALPIKSGYYIPRSRAFKALAVLKNYHI